MLHTRMTTLACILSELFLLDFSGCNALYFEYCQDYVHETIRFCRRGRDNGSCIQNMAALMFITPVSTPPPPEKKILVWILCQNLLTSELKIKFVRLVL